MTCKSSALSAAIAPIILHEARDREWPKPRPETDYDGLGSMKMIKTIKLKRYLLSMSTQLSSQEVIVQLNLQEWMVNPIVRMFTPPSTTPSRCSMPSTHFMVPSFFIAPTGISCAGASSLRGLPTLRGDHTSGRLGGV